MSRIIVDLGSWKTVLSRISKISRRSLDLSDRTILAVSKDSGRIVGVGKDSISKIRELGRENVELVKPIRMGKIMDSDLLVEYLKRRFREFGFGFSRKVVFILPSGCSGDLKILRKISWKIGSNPSFILNPISIYFGADFHPDEMAGKIVIDMGYEKTEISLLSFDGISRTIVTDLGWKKVERLIKRKIKEKESVMIDDESLDALKKFLGKSISGEEEVFVKGVNLEGKPVKVPMNLLELRDDVENLMKREIHRLRKILKDTPVEMAGNVLRGLVILAGGMSFLRRVRRIVEEIFDIRVKRVRDPIKVSVEGAKVILMDRTLSKKFLKKI